MLALLEGMCQASNVLLVQCIHTFTYKLLSNAEKVVELLYVQREGYSLHIVMWSMCIFHICNLSELKLKVLSQSI